MNLGNLREKWNRLHDLKRCLHLFDIKGKLFCLDIHKCFFFEIDRETKLILSSLLREDSLEDSIRLFQIDHPNGNPEAVIGEIEYLFENRFFSIEDRFGKRKRKRGDSVSSLALIMATDCNLRCTYCFAGEGHYHLERNKMPIEVGKRAIDYLVKKSSRHKKLSVSFFGGEPLLNFSAIRDTVAYAEGLGKQRDKHFSFSITTNGTLLSERRMAFFLQHDFSFIISLDGPKDINDQHRKFPDGSGSYEIVVRNIKKYILKYPHLKDRMTIRGTFTGTTPQITRSLNHLYHLGVSNVSLEPCTMNSDRTTLNNSLSEMKDEYNQAADFYLRCLEKNSSFSFFHMHQMFFQVADGTQRTSQCGAGLGYLAIDPHGVIYPCHRLVGKKEYQMGSIFHSKTDLRLQTLFKEASVPFKPRCTQCWARYICGGGCHATAIDSNNNIIEPCEEECTLMKHRIKLGAWLHSSIRESEAA